jgi:hypothetical protein
LSEKDSLQWRRGIKQREKSKEGLPGFRFPVAASLKASTISLPYGCVLFTQGCLNKVPKTGWRLKIIKIYCLSSGGWQAEIKVWTGLCFLRNLQASSS